MLPITTNPSDKLFSRINIDEFERPQTPKIMGSIVFFYNFRLHRTLQELIATKWLEIGQGSLRTGTAIGFCTSREH